MSDGHDYYCRQCRQATSKTPEALQVIRKRETARYHNDIKRRQYCLNSSREWQQRNKERAAAICKAYRVRRSEARALSTKKWRDKNKPLTCYLANMRRAAKLHATPKWANVSTIKKLYTMCSTQYHVHHIVPLQESAEVCGLHCEENLIIIHNSLHKKLHADKLLQKETWTLPHEEIHNM